MKPHLTSLVLALALAAASQSTAATVTMNGKDYVFDDASILTAGKALTTGVPDAQAGATWLGGGQRYNIAGNASLANYGTLVIGSGSLDGTEVSGGQLYLSTYDKEGAITIDNDLIVGASTYSEGNWNSYCSLRFDPASGRIVLAGTVVLAADTAFSVQRNNNYIDGGINGAGQMLSLSFQNDNSVLNLAGGATLGTLRNYNLQSASEGAAGSVNLNAAKSGGNASDNTTYTIGTKSGSMTLNANTGVTLNLTEANGGVINAQTGSNVAVETVSRGATLNAASGSNVTVGFVGSGGVFNAAAGSTISYTGATLAGDVTGDSTFNWTADSLSVTGATFSAGSVTVAAGRDLTFDASTNITVGQMVLAGGVVNGLKVTAGTTLSQTAASTLSGLVLDGGTISFADGDLFT